MGGISQPRVAGLVALIAVLAALPLVLPNSYYYDIAILACLNALVAVGLNLLIGYAGQVSLGHAAFFGLGGYGSALLTVRLGWPSPAALIVAVAAVAVLAYGVGRPVLRLRGHYLAMATLGLGVIAFLVVNTEAWLTGGPDGLAVPSFKLFGVALHGARTWYAVAAALLVIGTWFTLNLVASPIGRALRAIHGSETAAQVNAIDVAGVKLLAFVLSAVFAAVAGAVDAYYTGFVTPSGLGFARSIEFVAMIVLGGMASSFGAIVGAAFFTILPQVMTGFRDFEQIVLGAILVAVMVFMPRGLVPSLARRLRDRGQ